MIHSSWRIAVGAILSLPTVAGIAAAQSRGNQAVVAEAVSTVGITVGDLDRSVEFFSTVLSFQKVSEVEVLGPEYERLSGVFGARARVARLRLGDELIELTQFLAPEGRPIPVGTRGNDHWFQHVAIVVSDMDRAYQHLRRHRVRHASTGPQRLPHSNPNAAGIQAFYFKDPDGHHLEVISFPPGKGDAKWQRAGDRVFLGIDHTAIVVGDTERSLRFYRDLLGFTVGGQSRNYGPEQARLNNVEGASLLITGLRLAAGPGVEFLQYLTPVDGREFPGDSKANDLWHWQTVVRVAPGESVNLLATSGVSLLSRAAVTLPDSALGFRRGVLIRDPDGHAVLVTER